MGFVQTNGEITKVYNRGKVTITDTANNDLNGGIVGDIYPDNVKVTKAYNAGELIGGDYVGGITGKNNKSDSIGNKVYYYKPEGSLIQGVGNGSDTDVPSPTTTLYDDLNAFLAAIGET